MFTGIVYKDTFTTSNQVRNTLRKTGVSFSRFTIEIGRLCTLYFRVFHYSNEEITVKQLQNLTFFISIGPRGSVEVLNFSVKIQMWCEAGICSGVALSTRTGVILQTSHLTIAEHKELPWTAVYFWGGVWSMGITTQTRTITGRDIPASSGGGRVTHLWYAIS